jgi:hypothetical protein
VKALKEGRERKQGRERMSQLTAHWAQFVIIYDVGAAMSQARITYVNVVIIQLRMRIRMHSCEDLY